MAENKERKSERGHAKKCRHHKALEVGLALESEESDFSSDKDELFEIPRLSGVIEWFMCLIFDVVLLLLEAICAIWLASSLYPHDMVAEYRTILVLLVLPSFINPFIWLTMKSSGSNYRNFGTVFVFIMLLVSLNSPFFAYLWHLYQSALGSRRTAHSSKLMANTFRMIQAIVTSLPLLVLNSATLAAVLKSDREDDVLDLDLLKNHLSEVKIHGLVFFVSFVNLVRASCLFNERLTFTVLFGIVALPFIILTAFSRIIAFSIVAAFMDFQWTICLVAGLFVSNIATYIACRKRQRLASQPSVLRPIGHDGSTSSNEATNHHSSASTEEDLIQAVDSNSESSQNCLSKICTSSEKHNASHRSGKYNVTTGTYYTTSRPSKKNIGTPETCWTDLPKIFALSVGSIVLPLGYTNDLKQHHLRLRGGLFILLNYVLQGLFIGLVLGLTVHHKVPNTIRGLTIANPSIDVKIPDSKIYIGAGGMDLALDMPQTRMNLGKMPAMKATLNTGSSDLIHAIVLPIVLAVFCLPFAIMRAAMMELDCFITHKKALDSLEDEKLFRARRRNRESSETLLSTVLRNSENKTLKARMYVTLCCGVLGMMIFTAFSMGAGAALYLSLH